MSAYDRLMAEALPTGTFGHAEPCRRPDERISLWTPDEQADHLAILEAELGRREGRGTGKPRLRLIEGEAA